MPSRRLAVSTAAVLAAAALGSWLYRMERARPAAPARAVPASVLLITVDTLRPDALGWVAGRNATPVIDRLAGEGFRFPAAVAPVPLTLPAHASILTGLWPRRQGLRDNGQVLPSGPATLAERLRAAGYATAAFVSGYPLDSRLRPGPRLRPLRRRAARWPGRGLARAARRGHRGRRRRVAARGAPALAGLGALLRPARSLRAARPDFRGPGARGAYDGEVAFVDHAIGALRAGLPSGRADVLTVFTGDHGESLGEHGEGTHGFFIYDTTVLVPMFVRFPGRVAPGLERTRPRGSWTSRPRSSTSLGLPPLPGVDGISLAPMLAGRTPAARARVHGDATSPGCRTGGRRCARCATAASS